MSNVCSELRAEPGAQLCVGGARAELSGGDTGTAQGWLRGTWLGTQKCIYMNNQQLHRACSFPLTAGLGSFISV